MSDVQAWTDVVDLAEQRALEKARFVREGVLRSAVWRGGQGKDSVIYSMLRAEWPRDAESWERNTARPTGSCATPEDASAGTPATATAEQPMRADRTRREHPYTEPRALADLVRR